MSKPVIVRLNNASSRHMDGSVDLRGTTVPPEGTKIGERYVEVHIPEPEIASVVEHLARWAGNPPDAGRYVYVSADEQTRNAGQWLRALADRLDPA